jgi:hypothetical protein
MGYYDQSYPPSLWAPPVVPTLVSINPQSMVVGGGVQPVVFTGTDFSNDSVIQIDGAPVSTIFTNATTIYTDYDPVTVGIYDVSVLTGENETSTLPMAVTASQEEEPAPTTQEPPPEYTAVPVTEIPPSDS